MESQSKPQRNQRCPCESGLKYKNCCLRTKTQAEENTLSRERDRRIRERFKAMEAQRTRQQGMGRPIISGRDQTGDLRVTVGNDEVVAGKTEVFLDFVVEYFGSILTREWNTAELRKPFRDRHVLLQWFSLFNQQRKGSRRHNGTFVFRPTGASLAFTALAYAVYLMRHNVDLQAHMVARLKDRLQFQGAYYEMLAASVLIRAGFDLELEDETDQNCKHCEFAAVSKASGKTYSVECKTRSVVGQFHKTEKHASKRQKPLSRIKPHMNLALQKPSRGDRIIFIDINAPGTREIPPLWINEAGEILEDYERTSRSEKSAYVFVTNFCFHWHLEEANPPVASLAHGFNIPDFGKVGHVRFSDAWRQRKKHQDAFKIGEVLQQVGDIPITFDGSLPSVTILGEKPPVQIGETYIFTDVEGGIQGTVTAAIVLEHESAVMVAVTLVDGRNVMLREPMTEFQMLDYERHRETYFGEINRNRQTDDEYEFYERLVEIHMDQKRSWLIKNLAGWMPGEAIDSMSHEDLVLTLSELTVHHLRQHQGQDATASNPKPQG
jgi:hypothetical protein